MAKFKRKKAGEAGQQLSAPKLQIAILELFRTHPKKQLNPKQVLSKLKVANNKDAVASALDELAAAHKLIALEDFRYKFRPQPNPHRMQLLREGRVDMTRSGAAYIVTEGQEQDVFVGPRYLKGAMHGDTVQIRVWQGTGRLKPEGEVVSVIERASEHFVGLLRIYQAFGLVTLDGDQNIDVRVPSEALGGGTDGDKVVVKITRWSAEQGAANFGGEITAVLGRPGTSDVDMQAILINNGFQISFPIAAIREADALPPAISEQEIALRRDMRDILTFTIDPIDAKDFDDALSIRTLDDGKLEIGVHIADVSHYVKPGSALDKEAYQRSTSVYLVDRVCPMLPERLSNELCSLRPNEDKLTFSAVFIFDANFRIAGRWFGKTVIHSDRRFAYEQVQEILESTEERPAEDYAAELKLLNTIAKKLRTRRFRQGSIDFDTEEVRFRLDDNGVPLEVYVKERKDAHMLIEEFMLLANKEVSLLIHHKEEKQRQNIPFVYRVHDEPDLEKVAELARFAAAMGFDMDIQSPRSIGKSYNRLIEQARKEPGLKLLAPLAIRTMAKAVYSTDNIGHYGLGFSHYTHFTSPIRRYSDVLAHRILERNLGQGALYQTDKNKLSEQCGHISRQEKRAADAERDSIKYKQAEFMSKHVGDVFNGLVSGLTDFGVFVELIDSHCEGLIPFERLPDNFEFASGKLSMRGRRTGSSIRMGDEVKIRILDTDIQRRRIEMAWVEGPLNRQQEALPADPQATKSRAADPTSRRRATGEAGDRRRAAAKAGDRRRAAGEAGDRPRPTAGRHKPAAKAGGRRKKD